MPSLAKRACSTVGCRNSASKGSQCGACERTSRGTTTRRGYDYDHQRLRVLAFQRDGWRCVDCGWRPQIVVECEEYGLDEPPLPAILDELRRAFSRGDRHLQGDHIVPFENRPGMRLNLGNYATRCNLCHNAKSRREGGGFVHTTTNVITLVCGPPGSGKTTYVNEHRAPGDIIWDFDLIMQAITGAEIHHTPALAVPYAVAMRDAFLQEAKKPRSHQIWIVQACPTIAERRQFAREFGASVVLMDTSEQACIERVRDRGPGWPDMVAAWFKASSRTSPGGHTT